jgi:peptidylprolyl isomerase
MTAAIRRLGVVLALWLVLTLAACGAGDSTAVATHASTRPKPVVHVPSGPPPQRLVVEDIREGSGPAVKAGDEIEIQFVNINIKTRSRYESDWKGDGVVWRLGGPGLSEGFERGIVGMKVGGRRELIIPAKLAYGTGPILYVVDLLAIE